jgi:CHAD domain-containing protein
MTVLPGADEEEPSAETTNVEPTFGAVGLAYVQAQVTELRANEPSVRRGDDVEAVHDMRVATRRLRAALRIFERAFGPEADALHAELGWLGRALGEVRDRDVQLANLKEALGSGDKGEPADQAAAQEIIDAVRAQRSVAHQHLIERLDSPRARQLMERLAAFVAAQPGGESAAEPATSELPPLIEARVRKVKKAGRHLDEDSPPGSYHQLRIRGKKLRYAVEVSHDLYGGPAERYEKQLVALQDLLGNHQDAIVADTQLHDLVCSESRPLSATAAFLLGELAAQQRTTAASLRHSFPRVYRRATGRAWKRLRRRLRSRN